MTEGVRGGEGHTREGRAKGGSETVNKQIEEKRRKNSALRDGGETEPPRCTWDRVPHKKLARRCQTDPVTPKSKRQTRVASTQQESKVFLMSMNAKVCS